MRKRNKGHTQNFEDLLIFLDIDGVLNTDNTFTTKYILLENNLNTLDNLIRKLNESKYRTKVILSSTWRYGYEPDYDNCSPQIKRLISALGQRHIHISGKTPVYKAATRDREILRYIKEYEMKIQNFKCLTLDDDDTIFSKENIKRVNLYKVNQHTGLVQSDIPQILQQVNNSRA